MLPTFRNERDLLINDMFLITPAKFEILGWLKCGFRADWAAEMPAIFAKAPNFLKTPAALAACRKRLHSEVKKGRMLGGRGWTAAAVEKFLRKKFYVIPCGAVPKNNDPVGRIIHNYSFPDARVASVNSALKNTSVKYISFRNRVKVLSRVDWYVKADLKNGYRQLPVHPTDWHTQVYSLSASEYYIDLNMPFGKANSAKIFCTWTSAWCYSFRCHFQNHFSIPIVLASYIDDFFGGPVSSGSLKRDKDRAKLLLSSLIEWGALTNTRMNLDKCAGPSRCLEILGLYYNSITKKCSLSEKKQRKYINRLIMLRIARAETPKNLEKIVGYLGFASWVIPYGKPFISHISFFLHNKDDQSIRILDPFALAACDIWLILLEKNWGLPYDFVLRRLPRQKREWFVDAATGWGYGGLCGSRFFLLSHADLQPVLDQYNVNSKTQIFIAYRELLAALFAFQIFGKYTPNCFIRFNSDNQNAVGWLNKGRCSKKLGFSLLAAVEFYKAKYGLKVKAVYIPSSNNTSADALSRGKTPIWLEQRGTKEKVNLLELFRLLDNPKKFWYKLRNPFKAYGNSSKPSGK